MTSRRTIPLLTGPPVVAASRLIVIDPGTHSLKLLVAARRGPSIRVVDMRVISLTDEGLVAPEELGRLLGRVLDELGDSPLVLVLPPQIALSQLVDLPASGGAGVQQLIEAEMFKARGGREGSLVYNFVPLEPFGRHDNAFWVTLCKEPDVFAQLQRLSLPEENVYDAVAAANVLPAGSPSSVQSSSVPAAIVDMGASATSVTLSVRGQPVFSASFPIGGTLVTEAVATDRKITIEAAETLKKTKDLFADESASPGLLRTLAAWRAEVERILEDWTRDNPEIGVSADKISVTLSGGASLQPGFLEVLNGERRRFERWSSPGRDVSAQFATCYGAAQAAFYAGPAATSLLPTRLREEWNRRRRFQAVLWANAVTLVVLAVLLAAATWNQRHIIEGREGELTRGRTAVMNSRRIATIERDWVREYTRLAPVLRRKQQTGHTLLTLSHLNGTRAGRDLWYVLLADQNSYFSAPRSETNGPVVVPVAAASTNVPSARRGFVAELCINSEGEAMRRALAQVVTDLKQHTLFTNVDTLSTDARRKLAEPSVILPDHHFALLLEVRDDLPPVPVLTNAPAADKGATNRPGSPSQRTTRP